MLIPPSALAVILASIGGISVGGLLMAGVIPGVLLGAMFAAYIILMAWLKPSCAPNYAVPPTPFWEKVVLTVKRLLPIGLIIFAVIGVIILGLATPTEAAASGTIATFIVTLIYRCFNWQVLKASLKGSIEIWVMVFMIIAASSTFSMILAYTGASKGLLGLIENLNVHPIMILIVHAAHRRFHGLFHGRRFHHDDLPARVHAHLQCPWFRPHLVRRRSFSSTSRWGS